MNDPFANINEKESDRIEREKQELERKVEFGPICFKIIVWLSIGVFAALFLVMFYYANRTVQCLLPLETGDRRYAWTILLCSRTYDSPSFSQVPYGTRALDNCTVATKDFPRSRYSSMRTLGEPEPCTQAVMKEWKEEIREGRKNPLDLDAHQRIG